VDRDGAEVAFAVAAAVGADREADGFERFDRPLAFVIRVLGTLERQPIDRIQLSLRRIQRRRVLHQAAFGVALEKAPGC